MSKILAASITFASAVVLTSCGSGSGGSETSPSCDVNCHSNLSAALGTSVDLTAGVDGTLADPTLTAKPQRAKPSNIVNNYDTATCADWAVTDKTNRLIVTEYFLVRQNDKRVDGLDAALKVAITTACAQLAPQTRVSRVAKVAIQDLAQVSGG